MDLDDGSAGRGSRNELWLWLNVAAAVAIIVALVVVDVGLYLRLVAGGEVAAIAYLVTLPALG